MAVPVAHWRAWLAPAAALLFLNASLAFENVWPTPRITWGSALSVEAAIAVLLLAAAPRPASVLTRRILPALWVVLVAGRYLAVTGPGLYGREFNVYWDAPHLGNVAAMLARAAPWWLLAAAAAIGIGTIALAYVAARLAMVRVADAAQYPRRRLAFGAAAALVVVLFAEQRLVQIVPLEIAFAEPVTPAYARQARFALAIAGAPGPASPRLGPSPDLDSELRALRGADVVLVFVESYGAIAFETPEVAAGLAAGRADLDAAIRETGRRVVSAYVESPTFGGSSWLAHLSLLSGVDIRDQYAYTALMASSRETILDNFARRGYRTVALMPGMRQAWPEGAFYRFDTIYGRDHLAYEGPEFGWWSIPDQYALARLDALERRAPARPPVFVVFPTSTTHAPFGPVPPYQPAWSRLLSPQPFDDADVARALARDPDLANLRPSYVRAMAYEYRSLAGYLRQQRDDLVLVVVGDHQPPAAVSGTDAPWDVPVHVIGPSEPVERRLRASGFRPGLTPQRPAIGAMHRLTGALLTAFDAVDDRMAAAGAAAPVTATR